MWHTQSTNQWRDSQYFEHQERDFPRGLIVASAVNYCHDSKILNKTGFGYQTSN